jgi:hypothetical protein
VCVFHELLINVGMQFKIPLNAVPLLLAAGYLVLCVKP